MDCYLFADVHAMWTRLTCGVCVAAAGGSSATPPCMAGERRGRQSDLVRHLWGWFQGLTCCLPILRHLSITNRAQALRATWRRGIA